MCHYDTKYKNPNVYKGLLRVTYRVTSLKNNYYERISINF